jgi:hypothetical protein
MPSNLLLDSPLTWLEVAPVETVRLAVLELHRCGHCARILTEQRLEKAGDGTWHCREQTDCLRARGLRPGWVDPELWPYDEGTAEEYSPCREQPVSADGLRPASAGDAYLCCTCWARFPEQELLPVQEASGWGYQCHVCWHGHRLPGERSTGLPGIAQAISRVLFT